jgi:hypothetical protein
VRLLVATRRGQGARSTDFVEAEPGEVVLPPVHACDEEPDGPCGCRRSLVGVRSGRPTTTVEVAEVPLDMEGLVLDVRASLEAAGILACVEDPDVAERWVHDIAWELVQAGARFPVGTVLERRGRTLQPRTGAPVQR